MSFAMNSRSQQPLMIMPFGVIRLKRQASHKNSITLDGLTYTVTYCA